MNKFKWSVASINAEWEDQINERGQVGHCGVRSDNTKTKDFEDEWGGCINKMDGGVILRRSDTTSI